MAATALNVQQMTTLYPTPATGLDEALFNVTDAVNGNKFRATGRELVIFHNTDSGAHNVVLNSVANALGRTGDVTQSIAADEYRTMFLGVLGWRDSNGFVTFHSAHAGIEVALLRLP